MYKIKQPLIRVGLWFVSFLVANFCFSLFWGLYSLTISVAAAFFVFTLIFASPAWCLCLPVVIAFKDAEGRRIWAILSAGVLVGPLSLLILGAADRLHSVTSPGTGLWDLVEAIPAIFLVFAVIVGSLTTCAYVYGLKMVHWRGMRAG